MADERQRERDLILSPNEFAFISDQTKGNINVYVGPYKASLSNTDQPIIFNTSTKRFEKCSLESSIQTFAIAPEGWYLVLKNPAKDNSNPKTGTVNGFADLTVGHKVNIPGPISFPLWSGQMVSVVAGHHLRSNQYLVVRVYDEKAARENWNNAVIKTQSVDSVSEFDTSKLTLGKLFIIKGTDVSFYIPPTGIEVVKEKVSKSYIREAVTLERLEYCILLDEDGNKRYVRGPAVVFPEPTETFIEQEGGRKFKAIELSDIKGLYIKVIAPYSENGKEYKEGDELFITGTDQMIYFPRKEHAIVKYDDKSLHYAVAIPAGEARYVMNRLTGEVKLRKGPDMFLPDPRTEVMVRRVLDHRQVALWFPNNKRAMEENDKLRREAESIAQTQQIPSAPAALSAIREQVGKLKTSDEAGESVTGDSFARKNQYSPPRSITLDTKYEGAVTVNVWTGYAIMVVGKSGERKVIEGPATYLLEYDEDLQVFSLSTGKPKSDKDCLREVYLRILNNKISDIVFAETKDFVPISIEMSYRLNFIGDSKKWFNVENYVKFLTDRFRSLIRNMVKTYGIEEFYINGFEIIRLGIMGKDSAGYTFKENDMMVYDLEVVNLKIQNQEIATLLMESQQSVIQESATLKKEKSKLEILKFLEKVKQETAEAQFQTRKTIYKFDSEDLKSRIDLEFKRIEGESGNEKTKINHNILLEELINKMENLKVDRDRLRIQLEQESRSKDIELDEKEASIEIHAMAERAKAITPDLISALQNFSDKELLLKMAEAMAPLAILGGESVSEVFSKLLSGTKLEGVFLNIGGDTFPVPVKKKKE